MAGVTVVVADDHEIWLRGMEAELGAEFEVVATATDAPGAIAAVARHGPDLVVVDLAMPGGGGLAVAEACAPATKVVILSVAGAERDVLDAMAAGAVGYLLKAAPAAELRDALRRAAAGQVVMPSALAALMLGEFRRLAKAAGTDPLTAREREVVAYLSRGLTAKQVAGELSLSAKTVDNHLRNALAKLHLRRKDQLIRWAVERGID